VLDGPKALLPFIYSFEQLNFASGAEGGSRTREISKIRLTAMSLPALGSNLAIGTP